MHNTNLSAGKKYPRYKASNNGIDFLEDLNNLIDNGTLEYQGIGTLKKGAEPMNIYRGHGEFVTLSESGTGMDLSILYLD